MFYTFSNKKKNKIKKNEKKLLNAKKKKFLSVKKHSEWDKRATCSPSKVTGRGVSDRSFKIYGTYPITLVPIRTSFRFFASIVINVTAHASFHFLF